MTDVSDIQAEVLNFQEEARGCFQLAQAETLHEVRSVSMGMAIGWLKLGNRSPRPLFSGKLQPSKGSRGVNAVLSIFGAAGAD
jgi:hypothetical protein